VTIRDTDRGARRVVAALSAAAGQAHVQVGVLGRDADKSYEDGVTVAMVAEWMEFGTPSIPARSWLRAWVDENQDAIQKRAGEEMKAVIAGKRTREQACARLGIWAVGKIQERIARGIAPELAQSTIDRKGSSTPLIDTGQLRSSITSRVGR
jgi:hypothetical protein